MSEERMRILKMLEDGKITADEAAKLLSAVETKAKGIVSCAGEGTRKVLHVEIQGEGDEKPKVNVNVPLELIKVGLGLIPKEARNKMEEKGIDLEKLTELIETGIEGKLVEVEHEKDGGKERITVEIE
jgi:hypothetical protein